MIKKLFLILAILFIAVPSFAANHYINAACSSGCDGTTWAKGWATFGDVTWTRGDTYYVAGGTYNESPIITKAESGASWIIIKKANAADNGGDPGWNASYASDVAQINGTLYIDSSYIEVNGVTGSANSGHGIKVNFQSDCGTYEVPGYAIQLTWDIKEIYLHHIEALACSSTSNKQTRGVSFNSAGSTNSKKIHLQHMFIHDVTENVHTFLGVNGTSWEDYGLLVEDSFTEDVGLSPIVEVHCQVFQFGPGSTQSYIIIRNNTFHDPFGGISFLGGSTSDYVRIYNNIFATTQPDLYMVSPGAIWSHANVGTSVSNIEIYNNVFYNMSPAAALSFQSPTTINITARNNIWENSVFASGYIGVDVSTNNGYFGNTGGGIPSGETGQINGASTTFTSPTTYDFTLKSDGYALNGGYDLSSIFTGDIDGNTRTVPWDIGAYEYGEDTTPPVISNILPSGVQQCDAASPVDITLSVTTNENATCKYDTSDTTYDLMANTYGTTGTTSHSQVISLACDDSYTYYTRCMDASPQQNKNLTSATHTFSIGPPEGVDATPPVMVNAGPSEDFECASNPRNVTLTVTASDETQTVTCKYDTSDTTYDLMSGTFGTKVGDLFTQDVSLACGSPYTYYYRCADGVTPANKNTVSVSATFNVLSPSVAGVIEGESGTEVAPMAEVVDASASGGYYIATDTSESGTATFTVPVATTGTYRIIARVYAADSGTDSFYLKIDALDADIWDLNPSADPNYFNVWFMDYVTKRGTGTFDNPQQDPYQVYLTAGNHTFVFSGRERYARLDYFYLEPQFVMEGVSLTGASVR